MSDQQVTATGDDAAGSVETLVAVYEQVYSATMQIRHWMTRISVGVIGLYLAVAGWGVTSEKSFGADQRVVLVAGMLLILAIALYAQWTHYKEYCVNARLIVRLEKGMALYRKGAYVPGETIYPEENMQWGIGGMFTRHIIAANVVILTLACAFGVAVVIYS